MTGVTGCHSGRERGNYGRITWDSELVTCDTEDEMGDSGRDTCDTEGERSDSGRVTFGTEGERKGFERADWLK